MLAGSDAELKRCECDEILHNHQDEGGRIIQRDEEHPFSEPSPFMKQEVENVSDTFLSVSCVSVCRVGGGLDVSPEVFLSLLSAEDAGW